MADSVQNKTLGNKLDEITTFINGQVDSSDSLEMWQMVHEHSGGWLIAIEEEIEEEHWAEREAAELVKGMSDEDMEPGEPEEGGDG